MFHSTVFLSFLFLLTSQGTEAKKFYFEFENNLEGWLTYRGNWYWSNRAGLTNPVPPSTGNGFAVMDAIYSSDELYTPYFAMTQGGTFTIKFFLRSRWVGSNTLYVDVYPNGGSATRLLDLSQYSSPASNQWITVSADIDPSTVPIALVVFCSNNEAAPAGELMYGCAVDQIIIEDYSAVTTELPTTQPTTTESLTTQPSTTEPPTTQPPTTEPPTTQPPTTEPPTTEPPTTQPPTTEPPITEPLTTEPPTTEPLTTEPPTTEPLTTEPPTTEPLTTEPPTTEPLTTEPPTTEPLTTELPTSVLLTTESPTSVLLTTESPTTEAPTTEPPTEPTYTSTEGTTETSTEGSTDTDGPTYAPTEEPTDAPTEEPTDATTEEPTDATTEEPTEAPTEEPTEASTEEPTDASTDVTSETSTTSPTEVTTEIPTTEGPQGPLVFDFLQGTQGWTLTNMNGASWERVQFNKSTFPVTNPPYGPWVLQVFSKDVFASTVVAQSPQLEAVEERMKVQITFWMDGTRDLPSALKVRRQNSFSSYDVSPILNLDPYGDQENHNWITFTAYLYDLVVGDTFSIILEGSLGGNFNNSVAVDRIVLEGVKAIPADPSAFFDFENDLMGWMQGNMDGGRWKLMNWTSVDPSLRIPQPADGDRFLFAERFDIHSGVIALESPGFAILPGERKKVHIKFWARGSVVYPAALRLRKKSVDGKYADLPFLNLAPYGDIDNSDWITLDKYYYIPVDETDEAFQLVIEADLGSAQNNMIAVDNVRVITEYVGLQTRK